MMSEQVYVIVVLALVALIVVSQIVQGWQANTSVNASKEQYPASTDQLLKMAFEFALTLAKATSTTLDDQAIQAAIAARGWTTEVDATGRVIVVLPAKGGAPPGGGGFPTDPPALG